MQPIEDHVGADLLAGLVTPQACDPVMEHTVPERLQGVGWTPHWNGESVKRKEQMGQCVIN